MRDPRIDPQPGDRVRRNDVGTTLCVESRAEDGRVGYMVEANPASLSRYETCTPDAWRSWCRRNKAEVVKEE